MDKTYILCFFHASSYQKEFPFRLNTLLKLHHVHSVSIALAQHQTSSWLLDYAWKAPKKKDPCSYSAVYALLVACPRSHWYVQCPDVQTDLDTFPTPFVKMPCADPIVYEAMVHIVTRAMISTVNIIQTLEFLGSLVSQDMTQLDPKTRLHQILMAVEAWHVTLVETPTTLSSAYFLSYFLCFDSLCCAVNRLPSTSTEIEMLHTYSTLEALHVYAQHNSTLIKTENIPRKEAIDIRSLSLASHCRILVWLIGHKEGRLYAKDTTRSLLLLILPKDNPSSLHQKNYPVNSLCYITNCIWINESMVMEESSGHIQKTSITYITCREQDIVPLLTQPTAYTFCFEVSFNLTSLSYCRIKVPQSVTNTPSMSFMSSLSLLWIRQHIPTRVCYGYSPPILECHVKAIHYSALSYDSMDTSHSPHPTTLILTSYYNNLHYLAQLQVGCWVVITNTEKYHRPQQEMYDRPCTMYLDEHVHIYPVALTHTHPTSIELCPVWGLDPLVENTLLPQQVRQVQQFNVEEDHHQHTHSSPLGSSYMKDTVTIQGLVVLKKLHAKPKPSTSTLFPTATVLHQHLGISLGSFDYTLEIHLRQPEGINTLHLYMDPTKQQLPIGCVPGAHVIFNSVARRRYFRRKGYFYTLTYCTWIQVTALSTSTTAIQPWSLKGDPTVLHTTLNELLKITYVAPLSPLPNNVHLQCTVRFISLSVTWRCDNCGGAISSDGCEKSCPSATAVFEIRTKIELMDGTGTVCICLYQEHLLFQLLLLTPQQQEALRHRAFKEHTLMYSVWYKDSINDPQLAAMCALAESRGRFNIYTQVVSIEKEGPNVVGNMILTKQMFMNHGMEWKTIYMKPVLKLLEVEVLDATVYAWALLDQCKSLFSSTVSIGRK